LAESYAYERLGAAIVEQACKDALSYPQEVKRFFCDKRSIFDLCMPCADGEAIYKQVMDNFQKYGQYTTAIIPRT